MQRRTWQPADRTGGPLDEIFDDLRHHAPDLLIDRLVMAHAGDDDNVYFLGTPTRPDLIQIDTDPDGQPPFIIEADQRLTTPDPVRAAATIRTWLTQLAVIGLLHLPIGGAFERVPVGLQMAVASSVNAAATRSPRGASSPSS